MHLPAFLIHSQGSFLHPCRFPIEKPHISKNRRFWKGAENLAARSPRNQSPFVKISMGILVTLGEFDTVGDLPFDSISDTRDEG